MMNKAYLLLLLFLPGGSASARHFLPGEAMGLMGQTSQRMGRSKTKSVHSEGVNNLRLRQKPTMDTKLSSKKVINQSAHMRHGTYTRKLKKTGSSGKSDDMIWQEKGKMTDKGDQESEDEETHHSNQVPKATPKGLKEEKKNRKTNVSHSKASKSAKKSSFAPSSTRSPNTDPTWAPSTQSSGSLIRQLSPYGLEYTVTEDRVPFRSEFLEVVDVTRTYLNGFFKDTYGEIEGIDFEKLLTAFVGSSFDVGRPVSIDFESSTVVRSSSLIIPTVTELDKTLSLALGGEHLNGFIGMLQSLPPQNLFSTTIFVHQTKPSKGVSISLNSTVQTSKTESTKSRLATTAAGASMVMLVLAVLFLARKRRTPQEYDDKNGKRSISEDRIL